MKLLELTRYKKRLPSAGGGHVARASLLVMTVLLLTSCGIFKDTQRTKTKTHTQVKETGVRIVQIPKDSIVYVPNVIIKEKDTTVTVENKNLILKTTYRNKRVNKIKAIQKPKKEVNPYERTEETDQKVKDSKSEGLHIQPEWFLYTFGGFALLIVVNNLTKRH